METRIAWLVASAKDYDNRATYPFTIFHLRFIHYYYCDPGGSLLYQI